MATLILAQRKFFSISASNPFTGFFEEKNRNGKLTALFTACAVLFLAVYFLALFASFYIGFGIQEINKKYGVLHATVRETELELQRKRGFLDDGGQAVLQSMEKVSGIKYIAPENVAVNFSYVNP